jgi:membrane protein
MCPARLTVKSALNTALNRLRRWGAGLGRGLKDIFWGLYRQDCLGLASQVAYSALFSLFPFLLLLNALMAYIPGGERVGEWLLRGLRNLVSVDSQLYKIVEENVFVEVNALSATLLSVGVVLTLWSASGAVMVLLKAVNRAYELEETRSWQKRRAMAVGWSVAGAVVIPIGVLLLVFGSWIGRVIGSNMGEGSAMYVLWEGLRWPVVFLLGMVMLAVFFRHASSQRHKWYAVLPGALFSMLTIVLTSQALSWFVTQSVMRARWVSYGAIGTVIILLFWAFLIGLMVLIGAQVNAVVGRAVDARRVARCGGEEPSAKLVESPHDE